MSVSVYSMADAESGGQDQAVNIRRETAQDFAAIREVVAAAFGSQREARLVDAIRASEFFIPALSLVAERDGAVVGHVMISHVWLDDGGGRRQIASLSPLAVAPDAQREGLGSALVRAVTAAADERGEPIVVLEGSPVYYGRFGFEHSTKYGIEIALPDWAPAEAAQVLRLTTYDSELRGRVVYPPAFIDAGAHNF